MSLLQNLREVGAIDALDLHFARCLGRRAQIDDEPLLAAAALANRAPTHGHVCVDLARVVEICQSVEGPPLPLPSLPQPEPWIAALRRCRRLVRTPDQSTATPLVLEGERLYLDRYWNYQQKLARALRTRLEGPQPRVDRQRLERDLERLFEDDTRQRAQREAVTRAVQSNLALITGGPGTGKTAAVVKLLALVHAQTDPGKPPRVALLAPSGKAAARLSESIRNTLHKWVPEDMHRGISEAASTIHRCLKMQGWGGEFRYHADNPLACDLVVVDEASMVDLPLMAKLVEAVPPSARLVLLGDPDQLVSVEMGSILGDICAACSDPSAKLLSGCRVHLSHTWRYDENADGIRLLAEAINAGRAEQALSVLTDPAHPEVELLTVEEGRQAFEQGICEMVVHAYTPLVRAAEPQAALQALAAFRVLCAHRRGRRGADFLNSQIEDWLQQRSLLEIDQPGYLGRPVMVTSNDERVRLYNGDVGVILAGEQGGRRLYFPSGEGVRSLLPALVPQHQTVFATTVHKSQGSEYDHVLVVLPESPSLVVTRQLLYTAVTRARLRVTLVGSPEMIRLGVERRVTRTSGLRHQLCAL